MTKMVFTDELYHNTGIGLEAENPDLGRYLVTKKDQDWGAFKTPTIRGAIYTSPYMHDGSLATLEDVIDWYDHQGRANRNPLARPSQAAALATLQHEDKIKERTTELRAWTEQLASGLRTLGVRTFPTETYFFLAEFAPRNAAELAQQLKQHAIFIKPLGDERLGHGFMRITTSLPDDNRRFLEIRQEILA